MRAAPTGTEGKDRGQQSGSPESTSQSDSLTRDSQREASERVSWGKRQQVRAEEAEARVVELQAQLDRLAKDETHVGDGRAALATSSAANHGRKASPLATAAGAASLGPGATAAPLQIQRVDTFGESLETSSAAAQRARAAGSDGAVDGVAAAVGRGAHPATQERLAMIRKALAPPSLAPRAGS